MNNPQSGSTPRRARIRRGVIVHRSGEKSGIFYQLRTGSGEETGTIVDLAEHNVLYGNKAREKVVLDQLSQRMPIAISSTQAQGDHHEVHRGAGLHFINRAVVCRHPVFDTVLTAPWRHRRLCRVKFWQ